MLNATLVETRATVRVSLSPEVRLQQVLEVLALAIPGSRSLAVGDPNGLPVVSLDRGPNTMAATAMATLAMSAAKNVCVTLGLERPEDVLIESSGWKVLVRSLGNGFTFLVVLEATVNLGLVKLEVERRCQELREVLDEMM